MAIQVALELGYEFTVRASYKQVFDLVSDVPASASHFPKLERLVDLGRGAYRWEMENVGTDDVSLRTVYASRYVNNRSKGTVVWTPLPGQGNAQVGGSWQVSKCKVGTELRLLIDGTVDVPLPPLMRLMVVPVVQSQFEMLVEAYIDKLIQVFGGEVEGG